MQPFRVLYLAAPDGGSTGRSFRRGSQDRAAFEQRHRLTLAIVIDDPPAPCCLRNLRKSGACCSFLRISISSDFVSEAELSRASEIFWQLGVANASE